MKHKRVLTRKDTFCIHSLWEDDRLVQLDAADFQDASLTGRVYTGRVQNIVQNIGAVFVEYQKGKTAYLEQKQVPGIRVGDILPIQITREPAGSKPPRCTANITLNGYYAVLVQNSGNIAVSAKITDKERRNALKKQFLPYVTEAYGWILRTNAQEGTAENILAEIRELEALFVQIQKGRYLTPFTELYAPPAPYLLEIRDRDTGCDTEIITDQPDVYEQLRHMFGKHIPQLTIRLYEDRMLSLYRLYSMQRHLEEAMSERVWLKSGAYLVIQQTEAMVVIDVNSGKAITGKKTVEETLLRINLEAAAEVARQLRLRNLSGIIVVDFIDLKQEESEETLLKEVRRLLRQDPIPAELVEMTRLKFAVLTRKKVRMPLAEQIKNRTLQM